MSQKKSVYYQIGLIILGSILTLSCSYVFWCGQQDIDRKHLAHALYDEIDMLDDTVVPLAVTMENTPNNINGDKIPQVIYPDNGLYYSYRKEITAYDKGLADNLSDFYNHIIVAENDRKVLMDIYMGVNKNTPTEKKAELEDASGLISQRMRSSIISSAELIPSIKKDLEDYLGIEPQDQDEAVCTASNELSQTALRLGISTPSPSVI